MAHNIDKQLQSAVVNSTKENFLEQSNDFVNNLPNADWIAMDLEMTGIQLPSREAKDICKDESPENRYPFMKLVPERYSIIQLGICLFGHKSSDDSPASVRRYKFTLFPPADPKISRDITLNPSAIHFLLENDMDLNFWAKEGIPFCTGSNQTHNLVEKFLKHQKHISSPNTSLARTAGSRKIVLTKDGDKEFHARVLSSLREWLDTPIEGAQDAEGVSFLLPRCNSFLRRSLYEAINEDYPYLVLETQQEQIRVWRLTMEERERRNQRLLVEGYKKLIENKIGAQKIFLALSKACSGEPILNQTEHIVLAPNASEAMTEFSPKCISNRKIPLVVHNGLMDLLFLMTHFHSPVLPNEWTECKRLVHSHFPIIYDTKILASDYCFRNNILENRRRTRLEDIYEKTLVDYPQWKKHNSHDDHAHDAAYDAYMTGISFCGLSYTIQDQNKIPPVDPASSFQLWNYSLDECTFPRFLYGRNKLYFHLSPYTIDFESPASDPLGRGMSYESTFRVANIDPSVTSTDIINNLSGLSDSRNQRVNFNLDWVNDTTFLVSAQIFCFNDDNERFKEHGMILLNALKRRFGKNESISRLCDDSENDTPPKRSIFNLWGLLGESSNTTTENQRPKKRPRYDSNNH